jgi:Trk-type K+ transport system membrane component
MSCFFQAVSFRSAGFSVVPLPEVPMRALVLVPFMLILSMYPYTLTLLTTTIAVDRPNQGVLL